MILTARRVETFTHGVDHVTFLVDTKTEAAVLYRLTILGEAARRLSAEFRDRHPTIAWSNAVATRNRLVHNFARVDLDIVWDTVQSDVPRPLA